MSGGGEERESLGGENIDGVGRGGAKRERKTPFPSPQSPTRASLRFGALPRLSLSSPLPLAGDLAPEMPYGDDCRGG